MLTIVTTYATFCALELTSMNIHMHIQTALGWKTFLTLSTWVQVFSSVSLSVIIQISFRCKPFVTLCTLIQPWLVIMWMLSDIITIIFSINSKWSFTCTICTALSTRFTDSKTLCNVTFNSPSIISVVYITGLGKVCGVAPYTEQETKLLLGQPTVVPHSRLSSN